MNLLYNTDFRKSTVRGTLVVAPAALALIVMLLWFGSIRNPDPLSADKAKLYSACPEGSFAPCADAALRIRALTPASPESDNNASRGQHVLNGGIKRASVPSNTEFPATAADKGLDCTISGGWFCLPESDTPFDTQREETGEDFDVQFPGASLNTGEGQDHQRCLLPGIPCTPNSGSPVLGQSTGVLVTQELRTY